MAVRLLKEECHVYAILDGKEVELPVQSVSVSFSGPYVTASMQLVPTFGHINLPALTPLKIVFTTNSLVDRTTGKTGASVELRLRTISGAINRSAFNAAETINAINMYTRVINTSIISPFTLTIPSSTNVFPPTIIQDMVLARLLYGDNPQDYSKYFGILFEVLNRAIELAQKNKQIQIGTILNILFNKLNMLDSASNEAYDDKKARVYLLSENYIVKDSASDSIMVDEFLLLFAKLITSQYFGNMYRTSIGELIELILSLFEAKLYAINSDQFVVYPIANSPLSTYYIRRRDIIEINGTFDHNIPNLYVTFISPQLTQSEQEINYVLGGYILGFNSKSLKPILPEDENFGLPGVRLSFPLTGQTDYSRYIQSIPKAQDLLAVIDDVPVLDVEILPYPSPFISYNSNNNAEMFNILTPEQFQTITEKMDLIAAKRSRYRLVRTLESARQYNITVRFSPTLHRLQGTWIFFEGNYTLMKGKVLGVTHNFNPSGLSTTNLTLGAIYPVFQGEYEKQVPQKILWYGPVANVEKAETGIEPRFYKNAEIKINPTE